MEGKFPRYYRDKIAALRRHDPKRILDMYPLFWVHQLGDTEKALAVRKRMFRRAWPFRAPVRDGVVPLWPQLQAHSDVTKSPVPYVVTSFSLPYLFIYPSFLL